MREILFRGGKEMREILFRAWDGKKMITDGLVIYNGDLYMDWRDFEDGIASDNPLMQYTRLKDKNGVKIFEGDIISYLHDDWVEPEIGVVEYMVTYGYPAFDMESDQILEYNLLSLITQSGDYSYFVAGNIYDNPELVDG